MTFKDFLEGAKAATLASIVVLGLTPIGKPLRERIFSRPKPVQTISQPSPEPTPELNLIGTAEYDHSFEVSREGLKSITDYEGFEPKPYKCQAGKWTIGYGHVIQPGEKFTSITEQEARDLFKKDLIKYENAVADNVKIAINPHQYDALTSLAYNIGPRALKKSTLMEKLNRGDYDGASNEFGKWNKIRRNGKKIVSDGLTNRRAGEKRMFNGGRK